MKKKLCRIALSTATAILMITTVGAQVPERLPQQTFRSAVDLVSIQASVRDGRGRVLQGLTAADFNVRDNGQLRRVLSVDADRQSPLSLAVLVDMSGSMRVGPKIGMARHVFDAVLAQLRTGVDEVALFTFDATLHERQGFTTDLAQLSTGLDDFAPFGATSLFDATAATARRLADRSAARKAILVLTDGIDTSSMMSASEVSGLAASIDAPVYVVATVAPLDQRAMIEAGDRAGRTDTTDLRDLADWTGGQLAFAASFVESSAVAARLVDELRLQYILSIEASPEREWRRLDVRVNRPSAIVKARSGYFGG